MRELWARILAVTTGVLIVLLSAAFAAIQNPAADATTAAAAPTDPPRQAEGRAVYDAQDCARCHSIAGRGSPRSPLDGVGARLSREEIRQWITGADEVRDDLSPRALSAKRAFQKLPADELDALVMYLEGLDGQGE